MASGVHLLPGMALDPGRVNTTIPDSGSQPTGDSWEHGHHISAPSLLQPGSPQLPAGWDPHKLRSLKCPEGRKLVTCDTGLTWEEKASRGSRRTMQHQHLMEATTLWNTLVHHAAQKLRSATISKLNPFSPTRFKD